MPANFIANPNSPQNFLSGIGFQFQLKKYPNVAFFCQSVNVPGMNLATTTQATRMNYIPIPGDEINFDDLQVRFLVDEKLKNYTSIHNWIRGMGHPGSGRDMQTYLEGEDYDEMHYSDGSLFILDSNFKHKFEVKFKDLFPVTLSGMNFDSTYTDTEYFSADAIFKYTIYDIVDLSKSALTSGPNETVTLTNNVSGSLSSGTDLVLTYTSTNARFLTIDNGVGTVSLDDGARTLPYATVKAASPGGSITYTITATGFDGTTSTASTTINVPDNVMPTSTDRTCIAIIDENLGSQSHSGMEGKWTTFRSNWPDRTFWLLQPNQGQYSDTISTLHCPPTFLEETDSSTIDL